MNIILWVLSVVGGAILIFGSYALLSRYVFNKVIVNKWILLAVSVILLVLGFFVINNIVIQIACQAIGVVIGFWFFDVNTNGNPRIKKEKKIIIKAKAKPNRMKNNKK